MGCLWLSCFCLLTWLFLPRLGLPSQPVSEKHRPSQGAMEHPAHRQVRLQHHQRHQPKRHACHGLLGAGLEQVRRRVGKLWLVRGWKWIRGQGAGGGRMELGKGWSLGTAAHARISSLPCSLTSPPTYASEIGRVGSRRPIDSHVAHGNVSQKDLTCLSPSAHTHPTHPQTLLQAELAPPAALQAMNWRCRRFSIKEHCTLTLLLVENREHGNAVGKNICHSETIVLILLLFKKKCLLVQNDKAHSDAWLGNAEQNDEYSNTLD